MPDFALRADAPNSSLAALHDGGTDLIGLYLLRFDRANTISSYRNDIAKFFGAPTVTLDEARQISFVHVNEYLAGLEASGAKPTTLQRKTAALRGFFGWLVALGLLSMNPADRQLVRLSRRVRPQDRIITVLTLEQAQAMVSAVDPASRSALRDRALLLTLLHTVLRRSEAAAMDFSHLRHVPPYWVVELPHTKGGADQFVKIPAHIVEDLFKMKAAYGYDSGPVWRSMSGNSFGRRLSPSAIYEIVKKHAEIAGILSGVGAHTLRHTGCTLAIENGASLQQVQAHARHKQLQTTMAYVHQRDRLRDSAADYIKL